MADPRLSAGGAVLSAAGAMASWFCCLPFALGVLGATGSGLAYFLGPLRPYIMTLSVVLLGFAFFQSYRPQSVADCGLDGDCSSPSGTARRRLFLWIAAGLTLMFIVLPYSFNWLIYWTL